MPMYSREAGVFRNLRELYVPVNGVKKKLSATAPAPPTGITIVAVDSKSATLRVEAGGFDGSNPLVSGEIELTSTIDWITKSAAVGTDIVFTGLSSNKTYTAKARVNNGFAWSEYGAPISVTTHESYTKPSAPRNLSYSQVKKTSLLLSWTAPADTGGGCRYKIYQGGAQKYETGTTSYTVTGLTPDTSYSFYVVAYNSAGTSVASNTISVRTAQSTLPKMTLKVETKSLSSTSSVSQVVNGTGVTVYNYSCSPSSYMGDRAVFFYNSSIESYTIAAGTTLTFKTITTGNGFGIAVFPYHSEDWEGEWLEFYTSERTREITFTSDFTIGAHEVFFKVIGWPTGSQIYDLSFSNEDETGEVIQLYSN